MPEGIWRPAIVFLYTMNQISLRSSYAFHRLPRFVHAAAISRCAWPSKAGKENLHASRGLELKQLLKLSDESPLCDKKLKK